MSHKPLDLIAEEVRRALDDMNFYEGTKRRDEAILRGIREAVEGRMEQAAKVLDGWAKSWEDIKLGYVKEGDPRLGEIAEAKEEQTAVIARLLREMMKL